MLRGEEHWRRRGRTGMGREGEASSLFVSPVPQNHGSAGTSYQLICVLSFEFNHLITVTAIFNKLWSSAGSEK